jgi:hypothetical protein
VIAMVGDVVTGVGDVVTGVGDGVGGDEVVLGGGAVVLGCGAVLLVDDLLRPKANQPTSSPTAAPTTRDQATVPGIFLILAHLGPRPAGLARIPATTSTTITSPRTPRPRANP